ncbi:interleukin 4/13A [Triplophysa rosa]|uniref:Interleukin 4/13A n=1 Tax=Triplophysa rosa TaxID=992332 RepID=A0A9W7WE55_TRIRA|nr:interleukin 4/13A [Triplophysa rosa]
MMTKTMILLVFAAVCVSAAPPDDTDKILLMGLFDALNDTIKDLPNENIFLGDLKVKRHLSCTNEFFCQAQAELKDKVSGLSGPMFEPFRTDKKIIRNLNSFNKRHEKTCKPADNVEILLYEFLEDLIKCVQKRIQYIPK